MATALYTNGEYLKLHPTWHVEDSAWKAAHVMRLIERHALAPRAISEIGCGAGAILSALQAAGLRDCDFYGYEVSPQAYALCQGRQNARLHFVLGDALEEASVFADVVLLMDVVEHVEDYIGFLRKARRLGRHKILHVPLDLSLQSVIRRLPVKLKRSAGHLHYFTKEIILEALGDAGYRVIDYRYTGVATELPCPSLRTALAKWPRKLLFRVNPDLAALFLGGFSLLILAE